MPFIETDYDQSAALRRIKSNLTVVKNTNALIKSVEETLKSGSKAEYEIKISCAVEDGSVKRFTSPIVVPDVQNIINGVIDYKNTIITEIQNDCVKHNISLLPEEKAVLEGTPAKSEKN